MNGYPDIIRNPVNKVATQSQYSKNIDGFMFDGVDGSQVFFWTYSGPGGVEVHTHEYDEYLIVIAGQYTLIIDGKKIPVNPGQEYLIKKGTPHGGEALTGTRTIDVFGGKRAKRERER